MLRSFDHPFAFGLVDAAREIDAAADAAMCSPFVMPEGAVAGFFGSQRLLSNFWFAAVIHEGETYPSVEHGFQAAKTLDLSWRARIRAASSPATAKRLGRAAPLRHDWDQLRTFVMLSLVWQKFQSPTLGQQLLGTGTRPIFEVTTPWNDRVWGVVARSDGRFVGGNRLGRILERVRFEKQRTAILLI